MQLTCARNELLEGQLQTGMPQPNRLGVLFTLQYLSCTGPRNCRWIGAVGYVLFGIIGAGVIPQLYPAVKWYMVAVAFISAPVFSVSPAATVQHPYQHACTPPAKSPFCHRCILCCLACLRQH